MEQGTKIILGIGLGAGLAYVLHKYGKAGKTLVDRAGQAKSNGGKNTAPENREEKIEYIMAMAGTNPTEQKSGFNGNRFSYNPKLGYALPKGFIRETNSGSQMEVSRGGELVNELYFNADGEQTDDPTVEAQAILEELTDKEVDIAYKAVRSTVRNPLKTTVQVVKEMEIPAKDKKLFADEILPRIKDVKALKQNPSWKDKWTERVERRKAKGKKVFGRLFGMKQGQKQGKPFLSEEAREERRAKREERRENRGGKGSFQDEVINRRGGSMWGGHRNDGKGTQNPLK